MLAGTVGSNEEDAALLAELRAYPQGADLLITALYTAANHYRHATICTPYPGEPFAKPQQHGGERSNPVLQRALADLPPVRTLCSGPAALQGTHPHCRVLLRWLACNKARVRRFQPVDLEAMAAHLRSLDPQWTLPSFANNMRPSFVLRTVPDPSAPAQPFEQGVVAYHGTRCENLHSIIHTGLQNLSGTKLQRTGAIFGNGIYLSTEYGLAFMFAEPSTGCWPQSTFGTRLRVQLVCEVDMAKSSTGTGGSASGLPDKYLLVQRADAIRLLYVLIFVDKAPKQSARINWCTVLVLLYAAFLIGKAVLTAMRQPF